MTKSFPSMEVQFEAKLKKLCADFEFFAHITSHDLRDPLRQARIYSDELLPNLYDVEKAKLKVINSLIDEVLEKIAILRDYSYVANDKEIPKEIDLNKIIDEIISELADTIKASNAVIKKDKLPNVIGNEKHLKRLFKYLIENSINFRKENNDLQISINVREEKDLWHFVISDNGIGLDKVYRELVFVLFQRLDNTAQNGSYGVGLAFGRKIVENHGGEIWYESDGENGTAFHFTLRKQP